MKRGRYRNSEIASRHREQFYGGKHKGESEHNYLYPYADLGDGDYVVEAIPVEHLNCEYDETDERVQRYMKILESGVDMGPSWGRFRVSRRNPRGLVFIFDGNHRAAAARALGYETVDVVLPADQYEAYLNCHRRTP